MRYIYTYALSVLLLFAGCKKADSPATPVVPPVIPPVETQIKLTLNRTNATPGDILEIKSNTKVTAPEVSINFKNVTAKGFLKDESTYLFVVPVVEAGSANISIPGLKNSNSMALTIDVYKVIPNPQAIVTDYLTKRNAMIDSLIKPRPGYNINPSPESIIQFSKLKAEWDVQYAGLSTSEKEIIAYAMQKNMPDPSTLSFTALKTSSFAKEKVGISDAGDNLVALAKDYVTAQVICISQIPLVVGGAYLFISAPNFLTGALFLVPFTTFTIALEVAKKQAEETGTLPGVAEEINEVYFKPVNTASIQFSNNTERDLNMTVGLRNLSSADANIHSSITGAFNTEQKYIEEESVLIDLYKKVTAFFSKLNGAYKPHNKIIGYVSKNSTDIQVEGSQLKVIGVSDSRLGYSTRMEGTTKKIKVTSTSTADMDFILKTSYVRSLDGKEFAKETSCKFVASKPASISLVSGDKQSATAASTLPALLVVAVKDIDGKLMSDVPVSWTINSGGGQLISSNSVTGSDGQVSNSWKIGPGGTQSVSAILKKPDGSHVNGSPVTFSSTVKVDTMKILSSKTWLLQQTPYYTSEHMGPGGGCTEIIPFYKLNNGSLKFVISQNGISTVTESLTGIKSDGVIGSCNSKETPLNGNWSSPVTLQGGVLHVNQMGPNQCCTIKPLIWISSTIVFISENQLILKCDNPSYTRDLYFTGQ